MSLFIGVFYILCNDETNKCNRNMKKPQPKVRNMSIFGYLKTTQYFMYKWWVSKSLISKSGIKSYSARYFREALNLGNHVTGNW
jgi:hypothetical protein